MTEMAEFWVAVAFGVFLLILLYYQVPKLIAKSLDDRADARIQTEAKSPVLPTPFAILDREARPSRL